LNVENGEESRNKDRRKEKKGRNGKEMNERKPGGKKEQRKKY
jgi:hypothetical protein